MSASDTVFHKASYADELRDERFVQLMGAFIDIDREQEFGRAEFPRIWSGHSPRKLNSLP